MGLDMNLYKKQYVKNWEHNPPEKHIDVTVKQGGKVMKSINTKRIAYIIEDVAYWRKANQIHEWFMQNCNSGDRDNGNDLYVSREQLEELLATCKKIIEKCPLVDGQVHNGTTWTKAEGEVKNMEEGKVMTNIALAEELLPTQSGFFFGSTDYDQYYIQDLEHTVKVLEEELKDEESDCSYTYSASW